MALEGTSETDVTQAHSAPASVARAQDLIAFIDASPTPYHAVTEAVRRLEASAYVRLDPREAWVLAPRDRRYVVLNGSTLIAFEVGTEAPSRAGFVMLGAHTDSPNLRVKPTPAYRKHGYRQIGVEVYGGVLLSTWLDRDLSLAGRVVLRGNEGFETRLIDLVQPVARIPNLCIHLNRNVNHDGLKLNAQDHLPPILGLFDNGAKAEKNDKGSKAERDENAAFLAMLASELAVGKDEILDFDLSLYDVQKGAICGAQNEFIASSRLDNLACSHAGLEALLEAGRSAGKSTRVLVLYDHEEVGSRSAPGAHGPFLETVLRRIVDAVASNERQAYDRAIAASFLVSADMAHAVHPNYADRHEPQHLPILGGGPVVKINAGQSYATDAESSARFIKLSQDVGVTPQRFVNRTDLACGSTIGPITAARLGVKTVDVGNPMLAMHSCRETAGVVDAEMMHRILVHLFETGNL